MNDYWQERKNIERDYIQVPDTKPITHTVVVTAPIQLKRWATSEDAANRLAGVYRLRGYAVTIEQGAK